MTTTTTRAKSTPMAPSCANLLSLSLILATASAFDAIASQTVAETVTRSNDPRRFDTKNTDTSTTLPLANTCTSLNTTSTCASPTAIAAAAAEPTTPSRFASSSQCGLWLAPSTIPGAGLGMYAGQNVVKGQQLQATGDLALPIIDIMVHVQDSNFWFLWNEYTWDAKSLNMDHEGYSDINTVSVGFGSAANCFLPLLNVDEWSPQVLPTQLHRSTDPGAGAFTLYGNRSSTATRDIQAGEELFVSYGESWFKTRPKLGPIPLEDDLERAQTLVDEYKKLRDKIIHVPTAAIEAMWDMLVRNTSFVESRVVGAFHHKDAHELDVLVREEKTLTELRIEQSTRSLDWLEVHGTCADHIVAGPSILPQAGYGAFSTRFVPKDTVVAHLPLIHIIDRSVLNMYHLDPQSIKDGSPVPMPELGVAGQQLLLNYCFGHNESTLLLCPYGPMTSYINHNQTRANIQLVWSDAARGNHMPRLLLQDLEFLEADSTAKLAFEVVALRDIEEGEEIFLDYGNDWEETWQDHVKNWKPLPDSGRYKSAFELNEDSVSRISSEFEILEDPSLHRPGVELWCRDLFRKSGWREHRAEGTLAQYLEKHSNSKLYQCDVMSVNTDTDGSFLYKAIMWYEDEEDSDPLEMIGVLEYVPREAFTWKDAAYSTDMFLSNAFRHSMGIPDKIFPSKWRNQQQATVK